MAFLDGRIAEVALDWYAQDDTDPSGTSVRTSSTTKTASSPTPKAHGSQAGTARSRDLANLKWIWDRFEHVLDSSDISRIGTQPGPGSKLSRGWCNSSNIRRIDTQLNDLRVAADAGDLTAAADYAAKLRDALAGLEVEDGAED